MTEADVIKVTPIKRKEPEIYYEENFAPEHARHDYYTGRGHTLMTVEGSMAERLGLTPGGLVTKEAFKNVLDGFDAKRAEKLVHSTAKRFTGQEWAFTLDKKLVAPVPLFNHREQDVFLRHMKGSAVATMDFAFRTSGVTRRGKGGIREEPISEWGGFCVVHLEGRHGQWHPHVHWIQPNVCGRADGTTGTIDFGRFFENMKLLNAYFNAELAARLRRELNLDVTRDRHGNPTLSFPPELEAKMAKLCEHWSPGSRAIKQHLSEKGIEPTPRARNIAHSIVRPRKTVVAHEDLWTRWRQEALDHDITPEMVRPLLQKPSREQELRPTENREQERTAAPREASREEQGQEAPREQPKREPILATPQPETSDERASAHERTQEWHEEEKEHAQQHAREERATKSALTPKQRERLTELFAETATKLTERRNYFSEATFVTQAVKFAHEVDVSSAALAAEAVHWLRQPEACVALGETAHGAKLFTTQKRWHEEQRLVSLAKRRAQEAVDPFASKDEAAVFLKSATRYGPDLGKEARQAYFTVAAADRAITTLDTPGGAQADQVASIIGDLAKHQSHFQVVAAAATSTGAIEFENASDIRTLTANQWLLQYGKRKWEPPRDRLRELREAFFGKRLSFDQAVQRGLSRATKAAAETVFGEHGAPHLSSKTLLVITEAQRFPTGELQELLELADQRGARVLVIGDSRGFPAISHPGSFRTLKEFFPGASMQETRTSWVYSERETPDRDVRIARPRGAPDENTLRALADSGRLIVEDSKELALKAMVQDWTDAGGAKRPKGLLLVANSEVDRRALNVLAQRERWHEGRIAPLHFLRNSGYRIHQSDRVTFTHGLKVKVFPFPNLRRVRAGDTGKVTAVDIVRRRITVKTDKGIRVTFDPKKYPNIIELGYALTTFRVAALRPDTVYALTGGGENLHTLRAKLDAPARDITLYATRPEAGDPVQALAREAARREFQILAVDRQRQLAEARGRREHKQAAEEARRLAEQQQQQTGKQTR